MRGDKGDGTPAGVAEARQRWAWANDGHIPDIVRCSAVPYIYEVKCFSPFTAGGLAGARNAAGGGVPSERQGRTASSSAAPRRRHVAASTGCSSAGCLPTRRTTGAAAAAS